MKVAGLLFVLTLFGQTSSFVPLVAASNKGRHNSTRFPALNTNDLQDFDYQIEKDIDELPHISEWPNQPIFFQSGRNTRSAHKDIQKKASDALPLGKPIEFETDLFKGKILLRVRNILQNVPKSHTEYFEANKKFKHIVIQGQFKESLKMSDVWFGDVYEKPQILSRVMSKIFIPFIQRLSPGVVMDFRSDVHKVLIMMAGDARALSINKPGFEPDMTNHEIPENTLLLEGHEEFSTTKKRRKIFCKEKYASKYEYDPDLVYTFSFHDEVIDFASYSFLGKVSLEESMNGNPFSITVQTTDEREIFRFNIFHELLTKYKRSDESTD